MKRTKTVCHCLSLALAALGLLATRAQAQYVYTTIDDPVALANSGDTYVTSISGNVVAGYYFGPNLHGFYHTLGTTNYTTIDDPTGYAYGSSDTQAFGISGTNIGGTYQDNINDTGYYGFIFNIVTSNYMTVSIPAGVSGGSSTTQIFGIDGYNVVGTISQLTPPYDQYLEGFSEEPTPSGYIINTYFYPSPSEIRDEGSYNLTNYTTYLHGISGTNIDGYWLDENGAYHGFIYNTATGFTAVTNPAGNTGSLVYGISSNTVVGYYADPNHGYNDSGFTYNMATGSYTTLRDPLAAADTYALGVSGTTVVGYYVDDDDVTHGFVASIPIPVLSLTKVGTNLVFTATNGTPGASCLILDTTNLTLPANQWSKLSTNVFNTNGDFTFTNAIVSNMPPTFYQLSETP